MRQLSALFAWLGVEANSRAIFTLLALGTFAGGAIGNAVSERQSGGAIEQLQERVRLLENQNRNLKENLQEDLQTGRF